MKISKKLRFAIAQQIEQQSTVLRDKLDEKFRNDEISHEVWKELYDSVLECSFNIKQNISWEIETYSGKR